MWGCVREDERFRELMRLKGRINMGYIQIHCGDKYLRRKIRDITEWEGYVIITWEHKSQNRSKASNNDKEVEE